MGLAVPPPRPRCRVLRRMARPWFLGPRPRQVPLAVAWPAHSPPPRIRVSLIGWDILTPPRSDGLSVVSTRAKGVISESFSIGRIFPDSNSIWGVAVISCRSGGLSLISSRLVGGSRSYLDRLGFLILSRPGVFVDSVSIWGVTPLFLVDRVDFP